MALKQARPAATIGMEHGEIGTAARVIAVLVPLLALGCVADAPELAPTRGVGEVTQELRNPVPPSPTGSRIAVANRGTNTITLLDTATEESVQIELEPGSVPMYAQNPFFSGELWIGDRGLNKVWVYDALRLRRKAEIPVGRGVFHMWNNRALGQLWVVNDIDKTMTAISLKSKEVLATVPIPADLAVDFKPHDITVTATDAIVTLLGAGQTKGWLVKFSGETFEEVDRLEVPADPHLLYWGFRTSHLYVAAQGGNKVLRLAPDTLTVTGELTIPGAHGIWANEQEDYLYVSNITSADGSSSLYTIDIDTFQIMPDSPADSVLPHPHNLMVSIDNSKLFATHSYGGSELTSIYDLIDGIPVASRIVRTGAVPFGIMLVRDPPGRQR